MNELFMVLWIFIAFSFAIAEFTKLSGNFFPMVLGGLAAVVAFALGQDFLIQLIAFAVVTAISFLVLRPLFSKIVRKYQSRQTFDPEPFIGQRAVVSSKVTNDKYARDPGRITVMGRECLALPENPSHKYNVGDRVTVVDYEENRLIVRK